MLAWGPGLDADTRRELVDGFAAAGASVRPCGAYVATGTRTVLVEDPDDPAAGFPVPLDRLAVEVIDPASGETLPPETPGALLLTPLDGRGTAVFRYRTGILVPGDLVPGGVRWRVDPSTGAARLYPTPIQD